MNRRTMIAGLAGLAGFPATAHGAEKPFRVSLIGDEFIGDAWWTGIRVELADGWKTYWRMPGEAGIPPQFSWGVAAGTSLIDVRYPLPGRYADASGETVGYQHEVVFPVIVRPGSASAVKLDLDLFFAVCRDICIPAQAKASIALGPTTRDPGGSRIVEQWLNKVPVAGEIATAAAMVEEDGKPVLKLNLAEPVDDIFVETETSAYFRKPGFSGDGREARLATDNVKDMARLKGAALKLTFSRGGSGLEQVLTLP